MRGCAQLVDITTNPTHNAEFHVLKDGKEKCVGNGEKKSINMEKRTKRITRFPRKWRTTIELSKRRAPYANVCCLFWRYKTQILGSLLFLAFFHSVFDASFHWLVAFCEENVVASRRKLKQRRQPVLSIFLKKKWPRQIVFQLADVTVLLRESRDLTDLPPSPLSFLSLRKLSSNVSVESRPFCAVFTLYLGWLCL